jgi:cytidylate kinase
MIIAIDGPAASGKSSTAQWVARRLGYRHVDSGALYRAATAVQLGDGRVAEEWSEAEVLAGTARVAFVPGDSSFVPLIDGEPCDDRLRSPDVTRAVSRVAQMPGVRSWVNGQVRAAAQGHDVVVDGRDIGTAVFPSADLKIFLIADPWERARRRLVQRLSRGPTDDEIAEETDRIAQRDAKDAVQSERATDAVLIDTTYITQEEQVDRIVALAHAAARREGAES